MGQRRRSREGWRARKQSKLTKRGGKRVRERKGRHRCGERQGKSDKVKRKSQLRRRRGGRLLGAHLSLAVGSVLVADLVAEGVCKKEQKPSQLAGSCNSDNAEPKPAPSRKRRRRQAGEMRWELTAVGTLEDAESGVLVAGDAACKARQRATVSSAVLGDDLGWPRSRD